MVAEVKGSATSMRQGQLRTATVEADDTLKARGCRRNYALLLRFCCCFSTGVCVPRILRVATARQLPLHAVTDGMCMHVQVETEKPAHGCIVVRCDRLLSGTSTWAMSLFVQILLL